MSIIRTGFLGICHLAFCVFVLAAASTTKAQAQNAQQSLSWPKQSIRIVVPFAPGGTTDFLARLSAERLGAELGQTVIVENRPGAGGNVGADAVAKAAPDGHTLAFITTNNLVINQFMFKSMPHDPIKAFAPVAVIAEAPQILVVGKAVAAVSLREFIALAKSTPGGLNYASAGLGSTPHLAAVQFERLAGVKMTHVPYRGAAPAVSDLASGQVQLLAVGVAPVAGLIESGDLRALASATKQRMSLLPNLPTASEAGLPGYESTTWFGLVAPADTPIPVIDRMNAILRSMVADSKIKERFDKAYLLPMSLSPEGFRKLIADELPIWEKAVRDTGVTMD